MSLNASLGDGATAQAGCPAAHKEKHRCLRQTGT